MKKSRKRLQELVERSGSSGVRESFRTSFWRNCVIALWIDHGRIRQEGGIEEVVEAYEVPEAAASVRKVLADMKKDSE